ncbi:glycerophosphodiester phosphodiesterase family protein [Rhizobiaceae bacterium]|nr:glycerophosphodiester phosphodiesterase family protein [Rhizobiaceae bacterium]
MTAKPYAHRGLHDRKAGIIENSMSAFRAAIAAGYAIECDVQASADGVAMVFHDAVLDRVAGRSGHVAELTATELEAVALTDGDVGIRSLSDHLRLVGGRVPIVIELKGDGANKRLLPKAVAEALAQYDGDASVMSFDPDLTATFSDLMPERPRGLTAEGGDEFGDDYRGAMLDGDLQFVSYARTDLACAFVTQCRAEGVPVISWTIRSPEQAAESALYADQITFEGFRP